jgi:hypothetical protein
VHVAGIADITMEPVANDRKPNEPVRLKGKNAFNRKELPIRAVAIASSYDDHDLSWDNSGKLGVITQLDVKGP